MLFPSLNLANRVPRPSPRRRPGSVRLRLEGLEDRTLPATVSFINPAGGDWAVPSNWSSGRLPGAGDDVVINLPGITATHSTGHDSVRSLTSADDFVISGGSLLLAFTSNISHPFTLSGGTLAGAGALDVMTFTWTGGTLAGLGRTRVTGNSATISTGSPKVLDARELDVPGAVVTDTLTLQNGAVVINTGTFDLRNDSGIASGSGTSSFSNGQNGTLLKSAGTGTSHIAVAVNSIAFSTVSAMVGTLSLDGGGNSNGNGTFVTNPNAAIAFAGGTYNVGGQAGNPSADIVIAGGTLNSPVGTTAFRTITLRAGALTGAGDVTAVSLTWTGGTMAGSGHTRISGSPNTIAPGSAKVLDGRELDLPGGTLSDTLTLQNSALLVNSGNFDLHGDNGIASGGGNPSITNTSAFFKSTGTGTAHIAVPINTVGNGNIEALMGTLSLDEGGSSSGSGGFISNIGAFVVFGGGFYSLNGPVGTAPSAAIVLAGGTVNTISGSSPFRSITLNAGLLTGAGEVTAVSLTWTGGIMAGSGRTRITGNPNAIEPGGTKLLDGRELDLPGAALTDTFTMENGALLVNSNGFDLQNDSGISSGGGNPSITNNSGFFKTAGNGTSHIAVPINTTSNGNIAALVGTLSLDAGGSSSGSGGFASNPTAAVAFGGGVYTLLGSVGANPNAYIVINGGTLNVTAGTSPFHAVTLAAGVLTGAGEVTSVNLTWTGGTLAGGGRLRVTNTPNTISGSNAKVLDGRELDLPGATLTDPFTMRNGALLVNTGTFDLHNDNGIAFGGGTATISNSSGFVKSAGSGVSHVAVAINSFGNGNLQAMAGTLSLDGGGSSQGPGGFVTTPTAAVAFGGGTYTLLGAAGLNPVADIVVNGATLNTTSGTSPFRSVTLNAGAITGSGDVRASRLDWTGGTLAGSGNTFITGTPNTISAGDVKILDGRVLQIPGAAVTDTLTLVNGATLSNTGNFDLQNDSDIASDGSATFVNTGDLSKSAGDGTSHVGVTINTLGNGRVLAQSGNLSLDGGITGGTFTISRNGTLSLTADGSTMQPFNNQGTLIIGSGATFTASSYSESGTLIVQAGGSLVLPGMFINFNAVSGSLSGGSYQIAGTLQFANAAVRILSANLVLDGFGALTDLAGNTALAGLTSVGAAGSLTLLNGASITTNGDLDNFGTVSVDGASGLLIGGSYVQRTGSTALDGYLYAATGVDLRGGVLSGTGLVDSDVRNAASVVVGSATTVGTLTITGAYTQTSDGNLTIKVGGPNAGTDFDQLVVGGTATLDGTLTVQLVNGFLPNSGDQFTVLTCAAETGAFALLGGDGGRFTALYDPMDVTLQAN